MKKLVSLMVVVVLGMGALFANPVDVNKAKSLGQKFVQAKFEQKSSADLQLYYTVTSDNGEACAYIFNLGNEGFVMVAASDNVRPILGYSETEPFDASDPLNGAMLFVESYKHSISYAIENNVVATPEVASMWASLENTGTLKGNRGKKVGPLVATRWNQNSPYNLYAPADGAGPGGRCYAGCVATAMSQVMKFWNHPAHGEGSHSYYCQGYGTLSANFGSTTYDWDNMPRTLSNSTQVQKEAVALLMYHCGVAVDMGFAPDGSGAFSQDVPGAMAQYFDYDYCVYRDKASYSVSNWIKMLKEEFDMNHPVYYSGRSSSGGHAFVADGYDEDDFIHFNFGWSGSDDNYYALDNFEYQTNQAAVFNFLPTYVYNNTMQSPTSVTATKTSDVAQEAVITWTNPTKTLNNQTVSAIDQIVVTREDKVIYTVDNPQPGDNMSFTDSNVPCYSTFEYRVYAVKDGVNGAPGKASESFGPTCQWKIVGTGSNFYGWKNGYVIASDAAGNKIGEFTLTNSQPVTQSIDMTIGKIYFSWKAPTENVQLSITIKDASNNTVYTYSGDSDGLTAGVIYEGNNGCGNDAPTETPGELYVSKNGDDIVLTWEGSAKATYGYNVYRDGILFGLAQGNEYVDEAPELGGHCYRIAILTDGGESEYSNEVCASGGQGCEPPRNIWYYVQASGKPAITWEAPADATGLSGYAVYRKKGENGKYDLATLVGAGTTEYKESSSLAWGTAYYYRVMAYYMAIDCYSAPAKALYGNEYFVMVWHSQEGVDENMAENISVYPNPAKDVITVKADNLSSVMVYNSIGQKVFEQSLNANETSINTTGFEAGIYMIRLVSNGNEVTRKISIIR